MYQYSYLLMGIIFFIFWLVFWFWKKNNRREMFIISVITGICGPLADILYTKDWWSPATLTGNPIGIESVLVGFMIGGIAAVAYEDIFRKRIKISFLKRFKEKKNLTKLIFVFIMMAAVFFFTYFIMGLNSLLATLIPIFILLSIIYLKKPDLIFNSIISGLILVVIAALVYSTLSFISPGWLENFWHFTNTPMMFIIGLPIDDFIWYLFVGAFIGPIYEFLQEAKLVDI